MISVVIATLNDERRLAGTLAALIPAAIDGLVHQVIVADCGSTDATLEIADDAGAVMVCGDLVAGLKAVREPWVLILDAGARLEPGWERFAHSHMQAAPARAGRIAPLRPGWQAGLLPGPVAGLLAPAPLVTGGAGTLEERARGARPIRGVQAVVER